MRETVVLDKAGLSLPLTSDLPRVRAALEKHNGNITHAAEELGVWKPYLSVLLRDKGLRNYAQELRVKSGSPATGRPRRSSSI